MAEFWRYNTLLNQCALAVTFYFDISVITVVMSVYGHKCPVESSHRYIQYFRKNEILKNAHAL